jgi:hypothetical protein
VQLLGNVILILLLVTVVSPVTLLCDCNKCKLRRQAQVHYGSIGNSTKQQDSNPRCCACEHIDGGVHTEETCTIPNLLFKLPDIGCVAEPSSPVSAAAHEMDDVVPDQIARVCKRTAMHYDGDVDYPLSDDND